MPSKTTTPLSLPRHPASAHREEGPGAWEGDHGRPTRRRARQLAAADEGGLLPQAALGDAAEAHDRQGAGHRTTRPSES